MIKGIKYFSVYQYQRYLLYVLSSVHNPAVHISVHISLTMCNQSGLEAFNHCCWVNTHVLGANVAAQVDNLEQYVLSDQCGECIHWNWIIIRYTCTCMEIILLMFIIYMQLSVLYLCKYISWHKQLVIKYKFAKIKPKQEDPISQCKTTLGEGAFVSQGILILYIHLTKTTFFYSSCYVDGYYI